MTGLENLPLTRPLESMTQLQHCSRSWMLTVRVRPRQTGWTGWRRAGGARGGRTGGALEVGTRVAVAETSSCRVHEPNRLTVKSSVHGGCPLRTCVREMLKLCRAFYNDSLLVGEWVAHGGLRLRDWRVRLGRARARDVTRNRCGLGLISILNRDPSGGTIKC
jgi:hypothetical protein